MSDPKREDQIASCFGQGINPKDAVDDYPLLEGDHNADEDAQAFEHIDLDDDSKDYIVYPKVD